MADEHYKYQIHFIDGPLKNKKKWVSTLDSKISRLVGVSYWLIDNPYFTRDFYRYSVNKPKRVY